MHWLKKVADLLNVRPGERRMVVSLMLFGFCLGLTNVFVQIPALALFLETFGASGLPYLYIAIAFLLAVVSYIYLRLLDRISFRRLLVLNVLFITVGTLSIRLILGFSYNAAWARFILPVWFEIIITVGNIGFFTLMNRLFNVRQGRRLIGVVRGATWTASIVGGLVVPLIVPVIGTINLFSLAAGSSVFSVLFLRWRLIPTYGQRLRTIRISREAGINLRHVPRRLQISRYIVLIFCLICVWRVSFYFVDKIFYDLLQDQFTDTERTAAFLGVFFGFIQGTLLIIGNLMTGSLIGRYGLRFGMLIMPVLVTGLVALIAASGILGLSVAVIFVVGAGAKLVNGALGFSIDLNVRTLLYQPFPSQRRSRIQTVGQGIIEPLANGLSGFILLGLTVIYGLGAVELSAIFLAIAVIWIAVILVTYNEYSLTLKQALVKRRLNDLPMNYLDESSVAVLRDGLNNPHAEVVEYSLDMLEKVGLKSLDTALIHLLKHPAPEVRIDALKRIERLNIYPALVPIAEHMNSEEAPNVREMCVQTLAALGKGEVLVQLSVYLDDPERRVRRGAMIGLLRSTYSAGVEKATEHVVKLMNSPLPPDRILAAEVLGRVQNDIFNGALLALLHDEDISVRKAVLASIGEYSGSALWNGVIEALGVPHLRAAAVEAIVSGGERVIPSIQKAFTSPQSQDILILIARICGRIKGDQTVLFLKENISHPDAGVRSQVLASLSACGFQAIDDDSILINKQIENEVVEAVEILAVLIDIGHTSYNKLLIEGLETQFRRHRERIFLLLSFLYGTGTIFPARDAFIYGQEEQRAYAVEVLDNVLDHDLQHLLIPLFDDAPHRYRLQRLENYFPQQHYTSTERVHAIILEAQVKHDPWIKVCALYTSAWLDDLPSNDMIENAVYSKDMLVSETAQWVLQHRSPDTALKGEGAAMHSTIEKIMMLKAINIFTETPSDVLANVAAILGEVEVSAGQSIIRKGEIGNSMYVIARGKVRVHDGNLTLNELEQGNVFGEMALLDPEPRSASVTAIEETLLFRLDQEPFYELIADRGEVARGIMRVLVRNLRTSLQELSELGSRQRS